MQKNYKDNSYVNFLDILKAKHCIQAVFKLGRALDCVLYLFLALQVCITINFRKNIKKNILNGYRYYLMTVC